MPIAETGHELVALATNCTVVLTLLLLAGDETETPAKARVPELSARRRAHFLTENSRAARQSLYCPYGVRGIGCEDFRDCGRAISRTNGLLDTRKF
jgi:hypothetical protein